MARLVELKTANLLEIAVKKGEIDKPKGQKKASLGSEEPQSKPRFDKDGPIRGGNSDNAIWTPGTPGAPGPVIPLNPTVDQDKRGKPTTKPAIAPTKTSTPEAWRVDAGGCLQCPSPSPNCPFPTEQACQSSLVVQTTYRIDAGGCMACPAAYSNHPMCIYTEPTCTQTSTGNVTAQCCNDPQGNQVATDCNNCTSPNTCGSCAPVNEQYFTAQPVGRLYEDEYDDEYGEIDDFESLEDNVKI